MVNEWRHLFSTETEGSVNEEDDAVDDGQRSLCQAHIFFIAASRILVIFNCKASSRDEQGTANHTEDNVLKTRKNYDPNLNYIKR